jgi:hypothetical protein
MGEVIDNKQELKHAADNKMSGNQDLLNDLSNVFADNAAVKSQAATATKIKIATKLAQNTQSDQTLKVASSEPELSEKEKQEKLLADTQKKEKELAAAESNAQADNTPQEELTAADEQSNAVVAEATSDESEEKAAENDEAGANKAGGDNDSNFGMLGLGLLGIGAIAAAAGGGGGGSSSRAPQITDFEIDNHDIDNINLFDSNGIGSFTNSYAIDNEFFPISDFDNRNIVVDLIYGEDGDQVGDKEVKSDISDMTDLDVISANNITVSLDGEFGDLSRLGLTAEGSVSLSLKDLANSEELNIDVNAGRDARFEIGDTGDLNIILDVVGKSTFEFVGDDIANIRINGFKDGDILNFSNMAFEDLDVDFVEGFTTIDSDGFIGTITILGNFTDENNFIFTDLIA